MVFRHRRDEQTANLEVVDGDKSRSGTREVIAAVYLDSGCFFLGSY